MFISVTNLLMYAMFAIHFSLGHVIGGGFSTDFGDGRDDTQSSQSENAAAVRNDRAVLTRIVRRAMITTAKPRKTPRAKAAKKIGRNQKRVQSPRARRDAIACALPSDLPQLERQLNSSLNASQFIGLVSQVEVRSPLPANQPNNTCPPRNNSWWPRTEVNLRSTCPWIYEEIILNANYYPRKLLNARCLCEFCVTANSMICESIKHNVTVFKVDGCRDGLAVMTKVEVSVVVGCHCANSVTIESIVTSG